MEKKGAKIKLIIWSIVLVLISIMLIDIVVYGNFNGSFFGLMNEGEYKVIFDQTMDISEINNLQVKGKSGTINIYKTAEPDIRVIQKGYEKTNEDQKVRISTSADTLYIEQGRSKIRFFYFGFGPEDMLIEIYLPEKEFNKISVECLSGKITSENLVCNDIYLKLSSGDIRINDITSENADLNVTSGNMYIEGLNTTNLKAKTTSGKMDVTGELRNLELGLTSGTILVNSSIMPDNIDCRITSGKSVITIPENDGFDLECHKTSGSFNTDFDILSNFNSDSDRNVMGKYKDGGSKVYFKITSGTIKLNRM